jgi:phosphatidylserine/phosphatidylglycerophosphate/cardiolipin synthase-like enzyme
MKKNVVIFSITCITFASLLFYFNYKKISAVNHTDFFLEPVSLGSVSTKIYKYQKPEKNFITNDVRESFSVTKKNDNHKVSQEGNNSKSVMPFFSPRDDIKNIIINYINNEKEEIIIAIFRLTDKDIAAALLNAHKKGVRVTLIVDRDGITSMYSKILALFREGIKFYIYPPIEGLEEMPGLGLMHHKILLCKGLNTIITGSFNYTKSAQLKNRENIIVLEHENEVFTKYWDELHRLINESSSFEKNYKLTTAKDIKKKKERRHKKKIKFGAEERT